MKTRQYKTVDKTDWGDGPWQSEPDKIQFVDQATGMPALIVRNGFGALCGYVGVPKGHKAHGVPYDDPLLRNIKVHGGLSFSGECSHGDEATTICHVPEEGEPDDVWWLGFDCAHLGLGDVLPAMDADRKALGLPSLREETDCYRTVEYVKKHIAELALQLNNL